MDSEDKSPSGRRRGCFGCLFTGTLGCGAFLFGAVVAAALFAPSLLGGFVARAMCSAANGEIDGSIEIEELELAWSERQVLRGLKLRDPDGAEVLDLTARVPSLLDLWNESLEDLPVDVTVHSARVSVDAHGSSNLERALARARGRRGSAFRFSYQSARTRPGNDPLARFSRWVVIATRIEWRDERLPGAVLDVLDLELRARRDGARLGVDGRARLGSEGGGELSLQGRFPAAPGAAPDDLDLEASAVGLPVDVLEALVSSSGVLAELLGPRVDVGIELRGEAQHASTVVVTVRADAARVELDALLTSERLVARGEGLRAWLPLRAVLDRALEPRLPPDTRLRYDASGALWQLAARNAELPLGEGGAPLWAGLALALDVAWPGRVELVDGESGRALGGVEAFVGHVDVATGAAPRVRLDARTVGLDGIVAPESSHLELELEGPLGAALLAGGRVGAPAGSIVALELPSELLARTLPALARLEHVLGPRVGLDLAWSDEGAATRLQGDVHASEAELRWAGRLEGGELRGGEDGTLVLEAVPSAALRRDVVEPIVPWIAHLEAAPGEPGRARVSAVDFRLPLDGSMAAAAARLEVDLGRTVYGYAPGFRELFGGLEDVKNDGRIPPFEVRFGGGRLRYEGLVLEVEGKPCTFRGSYDPETSEIQLDAEVPMSLLGQRMGVPRDAMGEQPMPLQVSGRWSAPVPAIPVRLDSVLDMLKEGPGLLQDRAQSTWSRLIELFSGESG